MSDIFRTPLTAQIIFDHVAVALAQQGCKSMTGTGPNGYKGCAYRGANNTKCGVGFLLTDDEVEAVGNYTAVVVMEDQQLPERLLPFRTLLEGIQQAHDDLSDDSTFTNVWEKGDEDDLWSDTGIAAALEKLAKEHDLSPAVLYVAFPREDAVEDRPRIEATVVNVLEKLIEGVGYKPVVQQPSASWFVIPPQG